MRSQMMGEMTGEAPGNHHAGRDVRFLCFDGEIMMKRGQQQQKKKKKKRG